MTIKKTPTAKATNPQAPDTNAVDLEAKAKAEQETQAKAEVEAKAKTAQNADTDDYITQWTVHHGNKRYNAGDIVALTAKAAKPLLASGAIASKTVKAGKTTEAKADR